MTIEPAIGIGISVFGAILLIAGIVGLIRDGRRIATPVYLVMGLGLVSIGAGLLLNNLGHPALLCLLSVQPGAGPLLLVGSSGQGDALLRPPPLDYQHGSLL